MGSVGQWDNGFEGKKKRKKKQCMYPRKIHLRNYVVLDGRRPEKAGLGNLKRRKLQKYPQGPLGGSNIKDRGSVQTTDLVQVRYTEC